MVEHPIFQKIREGDLGGVVAILQSAPETAPILEKLDNNGASPLLAACTIGRAEIVEYLMISGANIDFGYTGSITDVTPVTECVRSGRHEILDMLLDAGARYSGNFLYHLACSFVYPKVVETLIANGVEYTSDDPLGDRNVYSCYPIHIAACSRNAEILQLLLGLEIEGHLELTDSKGITALHFACISGDVPSIRRLLEMGADPTLGDLSGVSPIILALESGLEEPLRALLSNYDSISESFFEYAIKFASSAGAYKIVELLVELGASTKACEGALHEAVGNGHTSVVSVLLSQGLSNSLLATEALKAASKGYADIVELLIFHDRDGLINHDHVLLQAAKFGHKEVVEIFIRENIDHSSLARALLAAAGNGHKDIVGELVKTGLAIAAYKASFVAACANGHAIVAEMLLDVGIDENTCLTSFSVAACNSHMHVLKVILAKNILSQESVKALLHCPGNSGEVRDLLFEAIVSDAEDLEGKTSDEYGSSFLEYEKEFIILGGLGLLPSEGL